ncbi:MAG: hypothetical protein AB9M53_00435 [Leptothrix sp. (in: b-proteobacteria)]
MFSENLDVFLKDFGLPCTAAGRSFTGILDQPDETMSMAGVNVLSTMYLCTVKTSDAQASALVTGAAITVNGTAFVIRDVMLDDDGVFTRLTLSK